MSITLPPGCTVKNGRYYLVRKNKWHALSRVSEGVVAFWRAYYRLTEADPTSMAGVMLNYLDHGTGELTEGTRAKYEQAIVSRLIPYCGHLAPAELTSSHVAMYLEERKREGAAIAGNRERDAAGALEEGHGLAAMEDQSAGRQKRNRLVRERCMSDAEQKALRTMAAAVVIRQGIAAMIFALLAIFVHPAWAIAVILSFCL